jgi:hypothetical protein
MTNLELTEQQVKDLEHVFGNALLGIVPHYLQIAVCKSRPWTQEDIDLMYECLLRMVKILEEYKT